MVLAVVFEESSALLLNSARAKPKLAVSALAFCGQWNHAKLVGKVGTPLVRLLCKWCVAQTNYIVTRRKDEGANKKQMNSDCAYAGTWRPAASFDGLVFY